MATVLIPLAISLTFLVACNILLVWNIHELNELIEELNRGTEEMNELIERI